MLLFDPTNPLSAAYNPLLEIRKGENEVRDAQNIADILVDPEGALERRNHWEKTSHSLLVGAILHVLYAEADKTLAGVANFLSDPSRGIEATLNAMLATRHLADRVHPPQRNQQRRAVRWGSCAADHSGVAALWNQRNLRFGRKHHDRRKFIG